MKLFTENEKELHLYHFSTKTLQDYLKKAGFKCLELSPDFGIVEYSKRLINMISVIPYYLAGIKIFNAIEVYAIPETEQPIPGENCSEEDLSEFQKAFIVCLGYSVFAKKIT